MRLSGHVERPWVRTLQRARRTRDVGPFSPDGRFLATASMDGSARLFDPATGTLIVTLRAVKDRRLPVHAGGLY